MPSATLAGVVTFVSRFCVTWHTKFHLVIALSDEAKRGGLSTLGSTFFHEIPYCLIFTMQEDQCDAWPRWSIPERVLSTYTNREHRSHQIAAAAEPR